MSEDRKALPADVRETIEALEWYADRSMVTKQIKYHLNRLREQLGMDNKEETKDGEPKT